MPSKIVSKINTDLLLKFHCAPIPDLKQFEHYFEGLYSRIEEEWDNPSPIIARLTRDGYSVFDGPSLKNILYSSHITDQDCEDMKSFLIESTIKDQLEQALGYRIGVCNVRAYRFTHDPPVEKTHYKDNIGGYEFRQHHDALLPGSYKLMIYRSVDCDELTSEHSATEICIKGKWIQPVGPSPVGVIFSPNNLWHRASRPAPGRIRDCIELTIMKRESENFVVISSGAHAGNPLTAQIWENEE